MLSIFHMDIARILEPPPSSFLLLGARGTGKSTWLRHHYPSARWFDLLDDSHYFSLLREPETFGEELRTCSPGQWVCVDEIQRLPQLLNTVHRFHETGGLNFALTGSSARKLRRAGVNLLAGRLLSKTMFPFVPEELGGDFSVDEALHWGTLPIVHGAADREETLRAYTDLYLRGEIQAEALVKDMAGYARFLPVAALMHGQILNVSALARDTGVSRATMESYLQILEDTLLAFRLPATQDTLRVRQKRHPKLYWIDPGLVRALRGELRLPLGSAKGPLFEGFVGHVLRTYMLTRRHFESMSYWAAAGSQIEVDFMLHRGPERVAVEVKATERVRPEHLCGLRALRDAATIKRRAVVYLGTRVRSTEDNIDIWPLHAFLAHLEQGTLFGSDDQP